MELRAREAARQGKPLRHVHHWVPYTRISQSLKRAVLVAEDDAFWQHEGIDLEQIRASIEINMQRGKPIRGASTITQQLAKNLYLSPSRDPLRKFRELIITRRLEAALSKARILEMYLNVIEWGDGIWGAEAAARTYFGASAASLRPDQAALLAGAIINPRVLNPARPTPRLRARQRLILSRMGAVLPPPPVPVIAATPLGPGEAITAPADESTDLPDLPPDVEDPPPAPPHSEAPDDTAEPPS